MLCQQAFMKYCLKIKLCAFTTSWFTIKNTQGSTLKTNTVPKTYCRSDCGRWHFQLKQHWLQIRSKNCTNIWQLCCWRFHDGTTTSAHKRISLTSTSLSHGSPFHEHKISRKLHPLLLRVYCTHLNILHIRMHLHYESCKVKVLLKVKENLETMF